MSGFVYKKFLDQFRDLLEKSSGVLPPLDEMLENVSEKLLELEDVSQKEIAQAREHVLHDVREGIEHFYADMDEMRQWAAFDMQQLEGQFVEKLLQVADPTRLEWLRRNATDSNEKD